MRSLGGLLRLKHVAGHARRAGARTSMVPISEPEGPAGPWNNRSLETTTARARHGHGDNNFCVVGCRTTPWYGAAGIAQHPLHSAQCSEPVADVTLFHETSHQKYTNTGLKTPVEGFLASKGQLGLILATVHFYDRATL